MYGDCIGDSIATLLADDLNVAVESPIQSQVLNVHSLLKIAKAVGGSLCNCCIKAVLISLITSFQERTALLDAIVSIKNFINVHI
jgi:hypothetical protein